MKKICDRFLNFGTNPRRKLTELHLMSFLGEHVFRLVKTSHPRAGGDDCKSLERIIKHDMLRQKYSLCFLSIITDGLVDSEIPCSDKYEIKLLIFYETNAFTMSHPREPLHSNSGWITVLSDPVLLIPTKLL